MSKMGFHGKKEASANGRGEKQSQQMKVRWDNSNMRSAYANVCNVAGTREEIVFLFGMNQAFDVSQNEMSIQLSDRIVMSPFVAKRLAGLLNNVIKDYEAKYGVLDL
jgi:hypothetical protein